jgi:hypothetical protein
VSLPHPRRDLEADKKCYCRDQYKIGEIVMSWWPGWDSIAGSQWWSGAGLWASIAALILLGVFQVVSHRYSERHETLAATQRENTDREYNRQIAELHDRASAAEKQSSSLEKEAAILRAENLRLAVQIEPRRLGPARQTVIQTAMLPFQGKTVRLESYALDVEGAVLGDQIRAAVSAPGVNVDPNLMTNTAADGQVTWGVHVTGTDSGLVSTLVSALRDAGIETFETPPARGGTSFNASLRAEPDALIFVGVKPLAK